MVCGVGEEKGRGEEEKEKKWEKRGKRERSERWQQLGLQHLCFLQVETEERCGAFEEEKKKKRKRRRRGSRRRGCDTSVSCRGNRGEGVCDVGEEEGRRRGEEEKGKEELRLRRWQLQLEEKERKRW